MNADASIVAPLSTQARIGQIRQVIADSGERYKARYALAKWQDAIGAGIMLFSVLGMVASGWLWYRGVLSAWISIPLSAFFASLIHELEHDLIHLMYFRKQPIPHNVMLALCWLTRPLTINPWLRRGSHLHHHKHSGTESDVEERAITNGEPWRFLRLLMLFDGMLSLAIRAATQPTLARSVRLLRRGFHVYFPIGILAWATWYVFLGFHVSDGVAQLAGGAVRWSPAAIKAMNVVDVITAVLLAPNLLRSFSINFVSSNMHFYGDIEDGNIIQQTQVLHPWWMLPFQAFCFNFGGTHAIHHFVVGQPFYLRQMVAASAYPVMRAMGVRFNDIGTFKRANRWTGAAAPAHG